MKNSTWIILFLMFVLLGTKVDAQFKDFGLKGGVQVNGVMPFTEFEDDNGLTLSSYLFRGYLRFELSKLFNAELGAGYGNLSGDDYNYVLKTKGAGEYSTTIIPVDLRLLLTPFDGESLNPYFYAGMGLLYYDIGTLPSIVTSTPDATDGFSGIIPVGIGTEIKLSDEVLLDLSAGVNYSLTDLLNYHVMADLQDAYLNVGLGITFVGESMSSDNDKDGLTKREELEMGTDPNNPDTDGDGLNDGVEINKYRTDPKNQDSDNDRLNDKEEVMDLATNPNKADSDDDGLSDYDEVKTHNTDPMVADTDKEGLKDGAEVLTHKTNPLIADTDKDGLSDSDEVNMHKTNPLVADTDGDGLSDYDEVTNTKSNPLEKDTDKGTVDDFTEVKRGTNPNDASDDVVEVGVPIILEGITFATNKADITPESAKILEKALTTLKTYSDIEVEIAGHTDNVGRNDLNQQLSQKRADAVKAWLVANGIPAERMTAVGYGEDQPRVSNDTDENRRLNRRIEFKRVK